MAEVTITKEDIAGLVAALDRLDLPERQKALLIALIAMAPKVSTVEIEDSLPSFREQFAAAYSAGKVDLTVSAKLGIART
jgi:hypothetical protein